MNELILCGVKTIILFCTCLIVFKINLKPLFIVRGDCYLNYHSFLEMFRFQVILMHMGRVIQHSNEAGY